MAIQIKMNSQKELTRFIDDKLQVIIADIMRMTVILHNEYNLPAEENELIEGPKTKAKKGLEPAYLNRISKGLLVLNIGERTIDITSFADKLLKKSKSIFEAYAAAKMREFGLRSTGDQSNDAKFYFEWLEEICDKSFEYLGPDRIRLTSNCERTQFSYELPTGPTGLLPWVEGYDYSKILKEYMKATVKYFKASKYIDISIRHRRAFGALDFLALFSESYETVKCFNRADISVFNCKIGTLFVDTPFVPGDGLNMVKTLHIVVGKDENLNGLCKQLKLMNNSTKIRLSSPEADYCVQYKNKSALKAAIINLGKPNYVLGDLNDKKEHIPFTN